MAEFTNIELRHEREKLNLKRWEVGAAIGTSEYTVGRWESGETRPEPDDIDKLERLYKSPGMWHRWMMSHYDSYRERYEEAPEIDNLSAVIASAKFEIKDILEITDDIERDAIDGKIDDDKLKQAYLKEISEGIAALQNAKEVISAT